MDIIMAYASGLLPDENVTSMLVDDIRAETIIALPELTKAKFRYLCEISVKIIPCLDIGSLSGEIRAITSAQKLCRQLLAIYEQEHT